MMINYKATVASVLIAGSSFLYSGCTTTEQDTGTGAAIGAALGGIAGHNLGSGSGDRDKGALAGAVIGGMVGREKSINKQKNRARDERINQLERRANTVEVWIENPNGSSTPIYLEKRAGNVYVGPRGEHYQGMPSQQQLKSIYGL